MNINPNKIRSIAVLGCGGTGCHVAAGLARLEISIRALGGDFPSVVLTDPDDVDVPNVGRQLFTMGEVGTNKAIALCNRMNLSYGIGWSYAIEDSYADLTLVCVDSRASRARIYYDHMGPEFEDYRPLFLDFGNDASTGQVVFGGGEDLPLPSESYPALIDTDIKDSNTPSCSLAEALESQELFVNQIVATYGLQILWSIFRYGSIKSRGYFINLNGVAQPIPLNNPIK